MLVKGSAFARNAAWFDDFLVFMHDVPPSSGHTVDKRGIGESGASPNSVARDSGASPSTIVGGFRLRAKLQELYG